MEDIFAEWLKRTALPRGLTCDFCLRESFLEKTTVCDRCLSRLPFNDGNICLKCGRKTVLPTPCCNECSGRELHFDIARSVFTYSSPINAAIMRLKYEGERYLAEDFAKYLADAYRRAAVECDVIIFIPIEEDRKRKRGYNQAEVIARALSDEISLPVVGDVLYKKRRTESQVGLTLKQRLINLSGSFGVRNRSEIEGKRILLIDDVMTTGTTVSVASEKLRSSGAAKIFVLTVASVEFSPEFI